MRPVARETLRRFFTGLTEYAFTSRIGMADPPLIDYVSDLLVRFVRCDTVYRIRDLSGRPLSEVIAEAKEQSGELGSSLPRRRVGTNAIGAGLRTPTSTRTAPCFRYPCWGSFLTPTYAFSRMPGTGSGALGTSA